MLRAYVARTGPARVVLVRVIQVDPEVPHPVGDARVARILDSVELTR